jgi:hypothetical protein
MISHYKGGIKMSATARELANQVVADQLETWELSDPSVAVVSTEQLNHEDEATVRRVVAAEGYTGVVQVKMIRKVSALVIGKVRALADNMPSDNSD